MHKLVFTLIFFSSFQVFAHSGEEHETNLDADGFEIVSFGPSEELLGQVNKLYVKNVKPIFLKKCLSCHGINNSLPWYHALPGAKQLMNSDMKEAKEHMDMSNDFPFTGHGSAKDDLEALYRTIQKDEMPPAQYLLLHWDSKLEINEKKVINGWIDKSLNMLNEK